MIRLPVLRDELAYLEKILPDLEARPDTGTLASVMKERIEAIREQIRMIETKAGHER